MPSEIPEYKLRQDMYHSLYTPGDGLDGLEWVYTHCDSDMLISQINEYFTKPVYVINFPAKSYAVAVIYAKLLKWFFGVPIIQSLKDENLLFGNDRFFTPYKQGENSDIYEAVLFTPIKTSLPQVVATIYYFYDEFFIRPNVYFDNSTLINTPILDEEL